MSIEERAATIAAALLRDPGPLRTAGKLRRLDGEVRTYVAREFEGRRVELVDRHGGIYRGTVLVVSKAATGAFTDALTLRHDAPGLWPVTLSLATVDEIRALS